MTSKVIVFSYPNYPSLLSNLEKEGVKMGQNGLLRHGSFPFDLQGVSRAASHQIVRHRIASFSQQSQRYVKITRSYGYLKPSGIPEDVRVPVEIHGQKLDLHFFDGVVANLPWFVGGVPPVHKSDSLAAAEGHPTVHL